MRPAGAVIALPRRVAVQIGCRWTPEHAVFRDGSGSYFERSMREEHMTPDELKLQRSLIGKGTELDYRRKA